MRSLSVTAAVAAALAVTTPSHALGPSESIATRLIVAGSGAQRDNFRDAFATLCQNATSGALIVQQTTFPFSGSGSSFNTYYANDPALRGGPTSPVSSSTDPDWDFRAYTCKLKTGVPTSLIPTAIQGQNVAVYYRSAGDSAYALGAVAKNLQLLRLNIVATGTGACTQWTTATTSGAATNAFYCPMSGYNLDADTTAAGSALVNDTVQLAVTDIEPLQFRGVYWPTTTKLGAEPAAAVLTALNNTAIVSTGTVFGVAVSTAPGSPSVKNFSKRQLTGIFSGDVSNWSEVIDYSTGNAVGAAGPITVCRLKDGSGSQVQAGIYFLHQGCGGLSFVTAPAGPSGNPVIHNETAAGVKKCLASNPGSVGVLAYDGTSAGYTFTTVDRTAPSKVAAALGSYGDAFESTLIAVSGLPTSVNQLSSALRTAVRTQNGFATAIGSYISPLNAAPTLPVNSSKPVAVYTNVKNSCVP